MEEELGSGYRLSILVFNWAEKTGGQFSVCNLLCSVHRVGSVFQPQLRILGSSAPPAVAITLALGLHKPPVGSLLCQPVSGTNSSGDCPFWLFCRHGRLETTLFPFLSMADLCPNTQAFSPNCPNLFCLLCLAINIIGVGYLAFLIHVFMHLG